MDQGVYIDMIVNSVLENFLYGAILAIIVLILFLRDLKPTVIIALSIPISLMFAMVLMYFSGVTLNIISLSGLALGVGMLVDNSVVVIENIYRMRNEGVGLIDAAIEGAKQDCRSDHRFDADDGLRLLADCVCDRSGPSAVRRYGADDRLLAARLTDRRLNFGADACQQDAEKAE